MRWNYYTKANLALITAGLIIPALSALPVSITGGKTVGDIELFQSLWLLFGTIFTWWYVRTARFSGGLSQFWRWSILWWLTLLGRGVNWGRAWFPDGPHTLFRTISVLLIGGLIVSLAQKALRQELITKMVSREIPVITLLIAGAMFLFSDCVEHHRMLAPLLLWNRDNRDFTEELFELPMMFGLFIIAFGMMRHDKATRSRA